jgi:hypothetical protein
MHEQAPRAITLRGFSLHFLHSFKKKTERLVGINPERYSCEAYSIQSIEKKAADFDGQPLTEYFRSGALFVSTLRGKPSILIPSGIEHTGSSQNKGFDKKEECRKWSC